MPNEPLSPIERARPVPKNLRPATLAVRAGQMRTHEQEHGEAMFITSSFVFQNAEEAAARFAGTAAGNMYSRFSNPSVRTLEARFAALEGGERALALATGMAAINTFILAHLSAGDHIVASASLFGSTVQLLTKFLPRFGITTTFVAIDDMPAWHAAITPKTKLLMVETPSNPCTEIADITALAELCKTAQTGDSRPWLMVDNSQSPGIQYPLALGADVVMNAATKFADGQGRVLGGLLVGAESLIEACYQYNRTTGASLSPFNAWVITKGLETLHLRMAQHAANAQSMAEWLEAHSKVARVFYPFLPSHPQYAMAKRQQTTGGALLSFCVKGGQAAAFRVINATRLVSITANLGDAKTTMVHPATTTHFRIGPDARARAGIGDNLIRLSVGLEDIADLKDDLARGLAAL